MLEPVDDPRRGIGAPYEVDPAPVEIGDRGHAPPYPLHQALAPEFRQGARSLEQQDGSDGRGRSIHLAGAMIPESHATDGAQLESGRWASEFGVVASEWHKGDRAMTDDRIVKDSARDPEREALGSTRGGIRAAAGRAARKVAKKVVKKAAQKKTTKKTTAAAGKTTKKAGRSAAKPDRSAPAAVSASATRTTAARAPATKTRAARTPEAAAAASPAATEHGAGPGAVPLHDPGPAIEAPPPPAPMHPGAAMESTQEHGGGLGSLLALWGPLIIVGFLVLVFRGGEERESTVATGSDAPVQVTMDPARGTSQGTRDGETMNPAAGAPAPARPAGSPGAANRGGAPETFDGGFTMRTSMAGQPVFAGRERGAEMPAGSSRRFYPSPPGPYRDPRYRGLPTGESWSADAGSEWMWSAKGRAGSVQDDGGSAPVQWVQCAPPYYWCPAPSSPAW